MNEPAKTFNDSMKREWTVIKLIPCTNPCFWRIRKRRNKYDAPRITSRQFQLRNRREVPVPFVLTHFLQRHALYMRPLEQDIDSSSVAFEEDTRELVRAHPIGAAGNAGTFHVEHSGCFGHVRIVRPCVNPSPIRDQRDFAAGIVIFEVMILLRNPCFQTLPLGESWLLIIPLNFY